MANVQSSFEVQEGVPYALQLGKGVWKIQAQSPNVTLSVSLLQSGADCISEGNTAEVALETDTTIYVSQHNTMGLQTANVIYTNVVTDAEVVECSGGGGGGGVTYTFATPLNVSATNEVSLNYAPADFEKDRQERLMLKDTMRTFGDQQIQGTKTFEAQNTIFNNIQLGYGTPASTAIMIKPDDGVKTLTFGLNNGNAFKIDLKGFSQLTGLKDPVDNTDATTKQWVTRQIPGIATSSNAGLIKSSRDNFKISIDNNGIGSLNGSDNIIVKNPSGEQVIDRQNLKISNADLYLTKGYGSLKFQNDYMSWLEWLDNQSNRKGYVGFWSTESAKLWKNFKFSITDSAGWFTFDRPIDVPPADTPTRAVNKQQLDDATAIATNTTKGTVKGSTEAGKLNVASDGTATINGYVPIVILDPNTAPTADNIPAGSFALRKI